MNVCSSARRSQIQALFTAGSKHNSGSKDWKSVESLSESEQIGC